MDNREIDRLVAEKVMGWERWETEDFGVILCHPGFVTEDSEFIGTPWNRTDKPLSEGTSLAPNYSTDITYAWQVVEQINSLDLSYEENYQVKAKFVLSEDVKYLLGKSSSKASMAICLAALKAVGVEIE